MESIYLSLHDRAVEVRCPEDIAREVARLFPDNIASPQPTRRFVEVKADDDGLFGVRDNIDALHEGLTRGDLPTFLMEAVVRALIFDVGSAVALHAGAVAQEGRAVLVAGPTGSGKSSLVAWLIDNGFEYLTDEIAILVDGQSEILGLRRALVVKPGAAEKIALLQSFRGAQFVYGGSHCMFPPPGRPPARTAPAPKCSLIVFPKFEAGAELQIRPLTVAQTGLRLVECNLNARNLPDGGFRAISRLARSAAGVSLQYGDFNQLSGTLDVLARLPLDGGDVRRFLTALAPSAARPVSIAAITRFEIPTPTPRRQPKMLTIGMATYDDYDGVYFTVQALRLYHPEVMDEAEIIVVDNHPDGACAVALKAFEHDLPNYRYIPFKSHWGTAASRNAVFEEAAGQFVVCMDCHVLVAPGALRRLTAYLKANPDTRDLLQGPVLGDNLVKMSTHFHPVWRGGMYGCWEADERASDPDAPPFDIPMQGLGLFACRRAAWPGFNRRFRGFGGEEGYIHEKFRRLGGRTLCLPFLRWLHRFRRPMGLPYRNKWEDRIRNYVIGFRELGLPTAELELHFLGLLGEAIAKPIIDTINAELDADPQTQLAVPEDANTSSSAPS